MNEKALHKLEYYKILEKLEEKATCEMGKLMVKQLRPSHDLEEVVAWQSETDAALSRILKMGNVSFYGIKDIKTSLNRLRLGGFLNASELLSIASLLKIGHKTKEYGKDQRGEDIVDILTPYFNEIIPFKRICDEINRCIISPEEIADDATSNLRHIRRSMSNVAGNIHNYLQGLINGSGNKYLQDSVITMRNGRYCVPVKAEYRGQINGLIHDQSSSGQTIFIEPLAVVKLNNQLRELEGEEEKEIEAILSNLSSIVAEVQDEIKRNLEILVKLDFIFAKGKLALEQNATLPVFSEDRTINLKEARHPLINKDMVVPINISLGEDFTLLVITGPNTGGKTVSIKTVGLLCQMAQSGLHIPAKSGSKVGVFKEIYADIGDEQSIEQSLSTFSSHIKNVISFINKADKDSLILFDELGSGTDPVEGAALAISILSYLKDNDIRTIATTHYSELKIYALSTKGVENGSCEFDVETLKPTYRLLIGVPGKSNAFAISQKLGIPDFIIDKAKAEIKKEDESFEEVIAKLEKNRILIEKEKEEISRYKKEIEELKAKLQQQKEKIEERKEKVINKANEEARRILQEAKDYADESMKMFNKFRKNNVDMAAFEKQRTKLNEEVKKKNSKLGLKTKNAPRKEIDPKKLKLGESVKVLSMNLKGTVSSLPDDKGNLFVQMGIIRSKVNIKDLELDDEPVITSNKLSKTGSGKIKMSKSLSVSPEINLLGMTVDEAVSHLDKYLDDAYLAHLSTVRVVHGKGTGALRKGVHQYLKRVKQVKSFRLGEFGEGDAGVTIVEFKK